MLAQQTRRVRVAMARGGTVMTVAGLLLGALAVTAGTGASASAGSASSKASSKASAQAKTQAKKDLLVVKDMPKGWSTEKGAVGNMSGFPGASDLTNCIGDTSALIAADPPEVDSPYFQNKAQSLEVQDSIAIFRSTAGARAEYAAISNPKTPGCVAMFANGSYKQQIETSGGKGTTVGTITVTSMEPDTYGKNTSSYAMTIPITSQGTSVVVKILSIYFIKGTLGQQITMNSYGPAFPTPLLQHLTAVANGRL
jgi:hypothetical protein